MCVLEGFSKGELVNFAQAWPLWSVRARNVADVRAITHCAEQRSLDKRVRESEANKFTFQHERIEVDVVGNEPVSMDGKVLEKHKGVMKADAGFDSFLRCDAVDARNVVGDGERWSDDNVDAS